MSAVTNSAGVAFQLRLFHECVRRCSLTAFELERPVAQECERRCSLGIIFENPTQECVKRSTLLYSHPDKPIDHFEFVKRCIKGAKK